MNLSNPLEIIIAIVLILGSIWLIERIIAGAFKTVIFAILVALIFFGVSYNTNKKKRKPLPKFTAYDLVDYDSFKKKFKPYEKETINDIKNSFHEAKEDIKK